MADKVDPGIKRAPYGWCHFIEVVGMLACRDDDVTLGDRSAVHERDEVVIGEDHARRLEAGDNRTERASSGLRGVCRRCTRDHCGIITTTNELVGNGQPDRSETTRGAVMPSPTKESGSSRSSGSAIASHLPPMISTSWLTNVAASVERPDRGRAEGLDVAHVGA